MKEWDGKSGRRNKVQVQVQAQVQIQRNTCTGIIVIIFTLWDKRNIQIENRKLKMKMKMKMIMSIIRRYAELHLFGSVPFGFVPIIFTVGAVITVCPSVTDGDGHCEEAARMD